MFTISGEKKHQRFHQIFHSSVSPEKCRHSMSQDEDQGNKLSDGAYFFT